MAKTTDETGETREAMAKLLDIVPRHLNYLAQNGVVPKPVDGKWLWDCIPKYIRHLRDGAGANNKEDKARKLKAEADTAEMEAEQMRGTLCLRSDYLHNYADAIAQAGGRISRLDSLTNEQKEAVFAAIRDVRLPDLGPEVVDAP